MFMAETSDVESVEEAFDFNFDYLNSNFPDIIDEQDGGGNDIQDHTSTYSKDCKITKKGSTFYVFRRNRRSVNSTILHFQNHPGNLLGVEQPQVNILTVKDNLIVAGGFQGELIGKTAIRDYGIEVYTSPSGAVHFTSTNHDCRVGDFDMERFQLFKSFFFPWAVNHTSSSPDGKLRVVVGDNQQGMLVDSQTGKTVMALHGHLDFFSASAWHPNGVTFATGNQDKTCRIWDVRKLSKSVEVLKGKVGAIQFIRYTSDGRFMAMAEAADFVDVFDVKSGYENEQEVYLFGEISGLSFSPDTEALFIGLWDSTYGSLLEYGRLKNYSYLDSLI